MGPVLYNISSGPPVVGVVVVIGDDDDVVYDDVHDCTTIVLYPFHLFYLYFLPEIHVI